LLTEYKSKHSKHGHVRVWIFELEQRMRYRCKY
jgi:hypothetical protein